MADRFWSKVQRTNGCWLWTASKDAFGYGRFSAAERAHRHSWTLAHGAIPDGLCVLHRCDTPACVNPAHLFLGTRADNVADMVTKGRHINPMAEAYKARDECSRGHAFTPENTRMYRGARTCRECCRILDRARYQRDKAKRRAAHQQYLVRRRAA